MVMSRESWGVMNRVLVVHTARLHWLAHASDSGELTRTSPHDRLSSLSGKRK